MQVSIRELAAHEVDLLRELRLQALRDAPGEFGDSVEVAQQRPREYWEDTAASLTGGSAQRMFIAEGDGRCVGSVFALGDAEDRDAARLGGMWVDSAIRGQGIGRLLTNAVTEWALSRGLRRLNLWVADGDTPAHRLYLRSGFADTATRDTTRAKIDKDLVAMTFDLVSSVR